MSKTYSPQPTAINETVQLHTSPFSVLAVQEYATFTRNSLYPHFLAMLSEHFLLLMYPPLNTEKLKVQVGNFLR